ncbi:MAG: hypothetical protein IJ111_02995 [Eggerthellaceae bacterium]|nr:hypothetical protein [Eggerthellaceae bacterium]
MAHLAMAGALAFSLAGAPALAFADSVDDVAVFMDDVVSTSTASSSASAASSTVMHGLYASADTVFANGQDILTTAVNACGLYAEKGAAIIANELNVRTRGDNCASIATSDQGGRISIANSQVTTTGSDSPLLLSAGTVEADNVSGSASASGIATVVDSGRLLIANSSLTSTFEGDEASNPITSTLTNTISDEVSGCINLYRTDTTDASTGQVDTALFQARDASLTSNLESDAFFYLTNTSSSIVLSNADLNFDSENVKLLVAAGSDQGWGTAGKNGATVTFTAIDQQLNGKIEVDSISLLELFLLDESTWEGSSSIVANAAGTDLASNIIVNIASGSTWVVTENSTITTLNIEKGGALVDADGKAVTIVDADGNKLVDGASDVEVSVKGEFTTTVKTTDVNKLQNSTIDRTAFDEEYGTSTAFGTNGNGAVSDEEHAAELQAIIAEWFRSL